MLVGDAEKVRIAGRSVTRLLPSANIGGTDWPSDRT
jgi:hypothetical protein